MDYFSELLESYSKLKKRTYKIRFISEAEEPRYSDEDLKAAMGVANSKILAPAESWTLGKEANQGDQTYAYKNREQGVSVVVKGGYSRKLELPLDTDEGVPFENKSDGYKNFVYHWAEQGGASRQLSEKEKQTDIAASLSEGGLEELIPKAERLKKDLEAYAEVGWYGEGITPGQINKYLVPGSREDYKIGIIGKIITAEVRKVNEDGLSEPGKMTPAMASKILDNFEAVTTFGPMYQQTESEEQKQALCQDVLRQVGFYKGRMVLFGNDPSELLVVSNDKKVNKLYQYGLDAIEDNCQYTKESFTKVAGEQFKSQEKNAIKGVLFEAIHVHATDIINGDLERAREGIISKLTQNAPLLREIKAERGDKGLTLEEAFADIVQTELLDALGDKEKLKAFLVDELSLALPFAKFMGADRVEPVGLNVATGGREDINFIYSDPDEAEIKAEEIGSEVVTLTRDDGTEEYAVGVGLKRLIEISQAKFGEIGSTGRMLEVMDGGKKNSKGESIDKYLDVDFLDYIAKNLYDYNEARQTETINYANELEGRVAESAKRFLEPTIYVKGKKSILQTPQLLAQSLFKDVKKRLGFKDMQNSALRDVLFDKRGNELVLRNFAGDGAEAEDNRGRLAEKVARLERASMLKKDLNGGDEGKRRNAKNYILNMAYICGANSRNMAQLISDDSGKVLAVKHNEIINDIASDPDVSFEFKSSKIIIRGRGQMMILKQNHTSTTAGTSKTRTSLYIPKETLKAYSSGEFNPNKKTREEVSRLFIKGQIKLLEGLLNQTNDNPLL